MAVKLMLRLLLSLLLCLAGKTCAATPILLPSSGNLSVTKNWDILYDPNNALIVTQLSDPQIARQFQTRTGAPALGYVKGSVWLRLTILAPSQVASLWILELRSPLLNDVALFVPRSSGGYERHIAGDMLPVSARDIAYRNPSFILNPPTQQALTLYLRIRSASTMSFAMLLWTPVAFATAINKESLLFGAFGAANLILLLSSLWFYYFTRKDSFGFFSLNVFMNFGVLLGAEGFLYQYLLPGFPTISNTIYLLSWIFSTPATLLFSIYYLEPLILRHRYATRAFLYFSVAFALLIAILMLVAKIWWVRPLYLLWQIAILILALVITTALASRGHRRAQLMTVVVLLLLGGAMLRVGRNIGWIAPSLLADNGIYIGMLASMLLMSSAVSKQYNVMRNAKDAAQAQALRVALQAEHDLEVKVALRTQALHEAMDKVEAALAVERQAQDEQRQFLATVSHEIRTPLAIIDATAQNLEIDDSGIDPTTSSRYQKILRATQRLSQLLNDSLYEDSFDILRNGGGASETRLATLLADAAAAASLLSGMHHFAVDAQQLPDTFLCDSRLLRLVLRTLADNAVKYTPAGTWIRLGGHLLEGGIVLEVEDNGPGIATVDLPHIFERFYRGRDVGQQPGTGLGLSLARHMIETQGGSLTLDSKPGEGCCARIFLPSPQKK